MDDILVFGHSVTKGMWDDRGGWPQRLENFLNHRALQTQKEEHVFYTYNLGVNGDTTRDVLDRLEEEFQRRTEEGYESLIIVQIGGNDAIKVEGRKQVPGDEFRENIEKIIDEAENLAGEVVFVGDFPVDPELERVPYAPEKKLDSKELERYEEIKKEVCREKSVTYIDLSSVPEEPGEMLEEGVHPMPEGHRKIFEKVKEELMEEGLI